ncbi:MAG: hypothetical protein FJ290_27675, partial [Planctomycetes bacterium]|nr:hypothetical protein [Planctomycetota bacterium]
QQARLGNVRAAELVRAHRAVFRDVLAGMDGQEVETAGDSFLIVFAAPSEGVKFALHMQAAMRKARDAEPELPRVRVGVHQGQVVVERHAEGPKPMDVYGLQVSTAARIMELACGGQVLCSRAVFDDARAILRGPDLQGLAPVAWLNHGPYRFSGVKDSHEVCEVGEEGLAPLAAPPAGAKGWPAGQGEEGLGWRPAAGVVVPGTNWVLKERLGREKEGPLGRFRGEFGEVWKAWNPSDKSSQAFKFCFRRDRVPALKREATLLKRLRKHRHPNLVEVYDVTEGERPPHYLEMEYVEGPPLEEWLATGPPLRDRLEIIAQVADALDTVHAAGIYHRDIKPGNILLTHREDGALQAKLTDFGLGAAEDPELLKSIYASRTEGVAGTWDYIAPELREGGRASPQSDLYSLGLTLLQIATGKLRAPAGPGWEQSVQSEILREDIARCMDPDPAKRWGRAGELARALRSHDQRLRERELERDRERQQRRARRLRAVASIVGLVAAVMIVLGGYAWHQRAQAERQRGIAQAERDEARLQLGVALLERAKALEREGRTVSAFVVAGRAFGFEGHGGSPEDYPPLLRPGSDECLLARGLAVRNGGRTLWQAEANKDPRFRVRSLSFSPDGKTIASASGDNVVRLWDAATGQAAATLQGHTSEVTGVSFSPMCGTLASSSVDKTIRIWDVASRKEIDRLEERFADCLAFSPDGTRLAFGGRNLRVWDVAAKKVLQEFPGDPMGVTAVSLSPDGRRVASGHMGDSLQLWDLASGKVIASHEGQHGGRVLTVSFSPDGKWLASGGWDCRVRLWDGTTGAPITMLGEHTSVVCSVAFSSDGATLASAGGADRTIRLWDVATGETMVLEGQGVGLTSVAFSPDGKALASGGEGKNLRLWDVTRNRTLRSGIAAEGSLCFSPDGRTLASAGADSKVLLWDVATGRMSASLEGHGGEVNGLAFHPKSKTLASISFDRTVRLWDLSTGKTKATLSAGTYFARCVRFSPDGEFLASPYGDDGIGLWDAKNAETREPIASRKGHKTFVRQIAFSSDSKILASASDDQTILLWDVPSLALRATLREDTAEAGKVIFCPEMAFSPDGTALAFTGTDKVVRLWDLASRSVRLKLKGGWGSVAFSPDGKTLASGGAGGIRRLGGPTLKPVATAPMTARGAGGIRLWDVATGEAIAALDGDATSLCFSPDGKLLASMGPGDTLRLHRITAVRPLPREFFDQFRFSGLEAQFLTPQHDRGAGGTPGANGR